MIKLNNNCTFDFGCASGAFGFYGDGWWFEQPWRWLGLLRPEEFTIIVKTLTYKPIKGNYVWWHPWTCVNYLFNGSFVNCVGLSNPGYRWWLGKPYTHIIKKGYKVIVSIAPKNVSEAITMVCDFNDANIAGLQLNVSCPNVKHDSSVKFVCSVAEAVYKHSRHPITVKLAYQDDYLTICKKLEKIVAAFELINTVPFGVVYPDKRSPLKKFGYEGGVSGQAIISYAREALVRVRQSGVETPIISGGGIDSLEEVLLREKLGANAFVFGSIFMRRPWLPNRIIAQYRNLAKITSVAFEKVASMIMNDLDA
jgi:dihydroorotate dehydrogenase (NAD+) catalytic subunit